MLMSEAWVSVCEHWSAQQLHEELKQHGQRPPTATRGRQQRRLHFQRTLLGLKEPLKNSGSHIDASHSRQPLVKGERLVRYEVNAVMLMRYSKFFYASVLESAKLLSNLGRLMTHPGGVASDRQVRITLWISAEINVFPKTKSLQN